MNNEKDKYPYGCVLLSEEDLKKKYLSELCTLVKTDIDSSENKENTLNEYLKTVKEEAKKANVWTLIAKRSDDDNWICLQVGSAGNIVAEIKSAITRMLSMRAKKGWYGYFNREKSLFCADYGRDVVSQKYKSIYDGFDVFKFILIDYKKYVKDCKFDDKIRYAETKFAYDFKALYWNPSGIEYNFLRELENNDKK